MEFRQLRYYVSVVTHRSFTKASEKLHIAQPAISRHIQLLEDEFGVQLLVRGSRGIEMTEAGRRFKEKAEFILKYAADIKSSLQESISEPSGHVLVGVPPSLVSMMAPYLVKECAKRYPMLTMHIVEGLSVFLGEWLDQGRLDLALLTDYGAIPGIERNAVVEEQLVFVGAPQMLVDYDHSLPLSAIELHRLIITHGFREIMEPWLNSQQVEPTYIMELDSIAIVKDLLLQGSYCSILSYGIVHKEVSEGKLRALPIEAGFPITRRIVLATKSNRPRSTSIRAIEALMLEQLKRLPLKLETSARAPLIHAV